MGSGFSGGAAVTPSGFAEGTSHTKTASEYPFGPVRATAAAADLPSAESASPATRPPSFSRDFSLNFSASQRIATPSASPVTMTFPSFDHAAETTAALCPSRLLVCASEPVAHAHSTFLPVSRSSGPRLTTHFPSGDTASGIAYSSAGFFPAPVVFAVMVEGSPFSSRDFSSHTFTTYPAPLPKITLRLVASCCPVLGSSTGLSGNHPTANGLLSPSSSDSPSFPVAASINRTPSFVVTASVGPFGEGATAAKSQGTCDSQSFFIVPASYAWTLP